VAKVAIMGCGSGHFIRSTIVCVRSSRTDAKLDNEVDNVGGESEVQCEVGGAENVADVATVRFAFA
jgi:hypothetical protein